MNRNQANNLVAIISETLIELNFSTILNVPGHGGTEVTNYFQSLNHDTKVRICLNEEAAFSIAIGSAIFGKRSASLVKSHGLTKMANALTTTMSIGTNAANIIFVFDDVEGRSSDNILNTLPLIEAMETPYLVLQENPVKEIEKAYQLSESLKLPVIIYVNCQDLNRQFPVTKIEKSQEHFPFQRSPYLNIACPMLTRYQRDLIEFKLGKRKTAPKSKRFENIEAILPDHILKTYQKYLPFFEVFREIEKDFVSGDAGTSTLFGFPPNDCVDCCSYMGGSPGLAVGAYLAGANRSWSITGDFSFFAAGILGLNEALIHEIPIKLVLLANNVASATGGQELSPHLLKHFLLSFQEYLQVLPIDSPRADFVKALNQINQASTLQILVIQVP